MGGGGAPTPDTYASNMQATVNRDMYQQYQNTYKPVEDKLIAMTGPGFTQKNVAESKRLYGIGDATAKGTAARTKSRYGITPSLQASTSEGRSNDINSSLGMVHAANATRSASYDIKKNAQQSVLRLGKGTASDASRGFNTAAGLEANRNTANRNIAMQDQQGTNQLIGTAVGIGAAALL